MSLQVPMAQTSCSEGSLPRSARTTSFPFTLFLVLAFIKWLLSAFLSLSYCSCSLLPWQLPTAPEPAAAASTDLCLSPTLAAFSGGSSLLPALLASAICCAPAPPSPPSQSSVALPMSTWCCYLREGPWTPLWFSLVLPLTWPPPSLTQVCKSLLPMSASKLVYPPPIPAFITLPKWSDISSAEASRRCSQYPNHESWHNKWRQSAGGPGHLSHCATSRCQLHYSLKLPEKIT